MSEISNDILADIPAAINGLSQFVELMQNEQPTIRDYFAAHAPRDVLWHFEVVMPNKRPAPLRRPGDEFAANQKEIDAWDTQKTIRTYQQWPWVWADAMLSAREAT